MAALKKEKIQRFIQQNKFEEARKLCASTCKKYPDDPECWFLLGSILGQLNRLEEAADSLKKCIQLQGNIPIVHFNLGLIYQHQAMHKEAQQCFNNVLKIDPNNAQAHHALANSLHQNGNSDKAILHFQHALKSQPQSESILLGLSKAYISSQQPLNAINTLSSALKLNSSNVEAHFQLGNLYSELNDEKSAVTSYRSALKIKPNQIEILTNMGNSLLRSKEFPEAIECYKKALLAKNDSPDMLFNLGNAYHKSNKPELAQESYHKALTLKPNMTASLNNLGVIEIESGKMQSAIEYFIRSISIEDIQIDAYVNLANCYRDQRKYPQAITSLRYALDHFPENPILHGDLALLLLANQQFERGWKEYEWRKERESLIFRDFPFTEWSDEILLDKTILITAEQGIGDEIMFASCFNDLIKKARLVILECEPRLAPLYARSFPLADIHAAKQTDNLSWLSQIPTPDFWLSAGSLPLKLRKNKNDFSTSDKFLYADNAQTEHWKSCFNEFNKKITVGISWRGGHISQSERRSTNLEDWKPILELNDISFVDIQYGDTCKERELVKNKLNIPIHHWETPNPLENMDEFAAQINALDLVICVDNSTAHLSAALGKNTWVLQPYAADWRWCSPSQSSHWYPKIRQFYQKEPNCWKNTIAEISMQLGLFDKSV